MKCDDEKLRLLPSLRGSLGPGCGAFSFCFGDDVANGCQEGRHHRLSLMMLWALFVRLGDFRACWVGWVDV